MPNNTLSSGRFDGLSLDELLGEEGKGIIIEKEGQPELPTIQQFVIGPGQRCFEIIIGGKKLI